MLVMVPNALLDSVHVAGDKALDVRWDDGARGHVDLTEIIAAHHNLAPLIDAHEFAAVRLSDDGWSLVWPCGVEFGAPQLRQWAVLEAPVATG